MRRLHDLFSLDRKTVGRDFDPYLFTYFRKLFSGGDNVDAFLDWCARAAHLSGMDGAYILDAGCGFGVTCFGFAASDKQPSKMVGLDPSEGKINIMRKLASFLGIDEGTIQPMLGDAMDLAFDDETFDVVFVKDVTSHIRDRRRFISEIKRVLRKGGRLLLTDENNSLDLLGWAPRKRLWLQNEKGPPPSDSWMSSSYREMRKQMINEWRPDLSEPVRERLAVDSQGMWGEGLQRAVMAYSQGEKFENTSDFPFRHPVSGEYMEYPLNPFVLAKDLTALGFRAKVIRPWFASGNKLKKIAGGVVAALHPISIFIQPNFYLLAFRES